MILSKLRMVLPDEHREKILDAILGILEPVRVQSGCMDIRLCMDTENCKTLILLDEWKTLNHYKKFLCSEYYKIILSVIEMLSHKPEFNIHTNSEILGFDFVNKVRGSQIREIRYELS